MSPAGQTSLKKAPSLPDMPIYFDKSFYFLSRPTAILKTSFTIYVTASVSAAVQFFISVGKADTITYAKRTHHFAAMPQSITVP